MRATDAKGVCRHCSCLAWLRSRGLCWKCYYTPEISVSYPSIAPQGRRGVGSQVAKRLDKPTAFPPGSPEKVAVLARRAKEGLILFHPDDA